MKIRLPKGAPEVIATKLDIARGGSWSDQGVILGAALDSSPGGLRLYSVSAAGGDPALLEVPGLKDGRFYNPNSCQVDRIFCSPSFPSNLKQRRFT